jgi:hypothetical protein
MTRSSRWPKAGRMCNRSRLAIASTVEGSEVWRYDLKLWIGHSFEGATYLPR